MTVFCDHPSLVSLLFAVLLSLHLVTFFVNKIKETLATVNSKPTNPEVQMAAIALVLLSLEWKRWAFDHVGHIHTFTIDLEYMYQTQLHLSTPICWC